MHNHLKTKSVSRKETIPGTDLEKEQGCVSSKLVRQGGEDKKGQRNRLGAERDPEIPETVLGFTSKW